MTTGIDLILADHRRVDALFEQFAASADPDVIGQIVGALTDHDQAEHATLYPLAHALLGDADLVQRSLVAHEAVKAAIDRLRQLEGSPLVEAVGVLRALVEQHVADEEQHLLPALGERATAAQLDALGTRFEQAKQRVG
ncbi:MAG: hemerythrin domain-containing protein [Acidimicrobiales bacterium]|nr:hemerythrin domain-containing protein [Acidimicrobiales bacterium]MCB9394017.1 hemerythrin domain-containing protein [Acidimicrobiaceae bacterium]